MLRRTLARLCLLKSPFLLLPLMMRPIVDTLLSDDVWAPLAPSGLRGSARSHAALQLEVLAKIVQDWVRRSARRAKVAHEGVHVLRHTFCSHLAMRGAPACAIQELAGHQDLGTTQRYMHLSPAAIESAIRLLDHGAIPQTFGDIVETGAIEIANSSR
jgi:integrase